MPEGCGRATLHPGSIEEVARSLDPATIAARCTAHRIERPESPGDRRRIADIRPGDDGAAITVSDRAGIERCAAQHCDPDSAAASGQQAFALPAAADIDFTAARVTARIELGRLPRNDGVTEDNDPPAGLASGLTAGIDGAIDVDRAGLSAIKDDLAVDHAGRPRLHQPGGVDDAVDNGRRAAGRYQHPPTVSAQRPGIVDRAAVRQDFERGGDREGDQLVAAQIERVAVARCQHDLSKIGLNQPAVIDLAASQDRIAIIDRNRSGIADGGIT